ncbi:hypothetical protein TPY_3421 [Sulfobacillus acidophilus TPY]|nr:hypothetical protein TPY_3421 [Sulfobacillus acidophilus TPY]
MSRTETRVVTEAGQNVAPGEVGERWIRDKPWMKSYWNNPKATRLSTKTLGRHE